MRTTLLLLATMILISGCAARPPRPEPVDPVVVETTPDQLTYLRARSDALAEIAQELPGRSAAEDRALLARGFAEVAEILRLMVGRAYDGAMDQQLRIIRDSEQRLLGIGPEIASEPITDRGLRATYNALARLQTIRFSGDREAARLVEQLGERVAELDAVRGPLHSLVAARAMRSASQTISRMVDVTEARAAQQ